MASLVMTVEDLDFVEEVDRAGCGDGGREGCKIEFHGSWGCLELMIVASARAELNNNTRCQWSGF